MWRNLLVVAAAAGLAYVVINNVERLNLFQQTYNHAPGECRRLHGIEHGSEDIQALPNGLAFISSGIRLRNTDEYNKRVGRIYLFDFNHPDNPPQELPIKAEQGFQLIGPHGLSIWTNPQTGQVYLYVVSHQPAEIIDKFLFEEQSKTLNHLRRFTGDPNFHLLNDVAAVGEDQFYFTNYHYLYDFWETILGLHWGSLGFYNGTNANLIDTGLFIPNGVNLSPDGRYLYVAQPGEKDIRVYTRHSDNSITFKHSIKVWTLVDNLDVDAKTGDIWLGGHTVAYKALQYLDDPTRTAPSQIMRIQLSEGQAAKIEEIYSNDGTELSGSTVGVVYGKGLLIGSVASHALYCKMK